MPQMSPMYWMFLFIFFFIIYLITQCIIYSFMNKNIYMNNSILKKFYYMFKW
uniref:ATP synthase F0 subunit 8 n=1 Tax=Habroteleia persimilis TaxID=2496286 RepID=A0A3Q8UAB6_9HYME|nr:ATP synthase F0 subunit 8 [Habroteleia persimilis]